MGAELAARHAGPWTRNVGGRSRAGEEDAVQAVKHPVSAILRGAWRAEPGTAQVSEESLFACLPVVTSTGASGLAWNRIKGNAGFAASAPAAALRQQARMQVLDLARHEAGLGALACLLQGAGIAPVLFKGRAVAQYYAAPHLRAMGDADLCAPPGRFEEILKLLHREGFVEVAKSPTDVHGRTVMLEAPKDWAAKHLVVDLHEELGKFFLDSLKDVFARAQPLQFGDVPILTPAAEDHLRIVAIHFLRDGGWRPSSLCDVGALLESLPATFDWNLCLGSHPRRRRWIAASCELAQVLLDARLDRMPAAYRVRDMPPWLGRTVLGAWEKPFLHHQARVLFRWTMHSHPLQIPTEILARWPNGLKASMELDADFTRLPRWPYQLVFFAQAIGRFAARELRAAARRSSS